MHARSMIRAATIGLSVMALNLALGTEARTDAGAPAGEATPDEPHQSHEDIVKLDEDVHARMTVPVSISGDGPYPFLVDTGAERTVISRELATRLSLDSGKTVMVHSMTEVQRVPTAIIPRLGISQKTVEDVHAPALSGVHMGAAGMLGVDSLQSQRVLFDFAKNTMSISPAHERQRSWGPDAIVITGRSLYGRLILTDARIDGQKIVVVLDTGSQVSIGNEALRRQLASRKRLARTVPIVLVSVTGGRMTADYTRVRELQLGGIKITDMPIGFADAHPFRQLELIDQPAFLLGMDVLRLFDRVSVDFASKKIRFQARGVSPRLIQERHAAVNQRPLRTTTLAAAY